MLGSLLLSFIGLSTRLVFFFFLLLSREVMGVVVVVIGGLKLLSVTSELAKPFLRIVSILVCSIRMLFV